MPLPVRRPSAMNRARAFVRRRGAGGRELEERGFSVESVSEDYIADNDRYASIALDRPI